MRFMTQAFEGFHRLAAVALAATLLGAAALPACADDLEAPLLLVAQPKMQGEFYGSTVLIVRSIGNGRHIGFIVNRPSELTLGKLFPGHGASLKVTDPVYVGGPNYIQFVFALVRRDESPGGQSVRLAPDLYVAIDRETVDRIIENDASSARFVAGLVAWDAGELEDELKRGLWFVQEPEANIVMQKRVEGLWEELVARAERRRDGI